MIRIFIESDDWVIFKELPTTINSVIGIPISRIIELEKLFQEAGFDLKREEDWPIIKGVFFSVLTRRKEHD